MMRASTTRAALACAAALGAWQAAPTAEACGGLFCSQTPVDQSAERVVFTVHEDSTDMVVQITYQGDDEAFAWLLPLKDVPDPASLDTVPIASLIALDNQTEPQFSLHPDCQYYYWEDFGVLAAAGGGGDGGAGAEDDGVTVFFEQQVGPYVAVALQSDDPAATAKWLRDNEYNIGANMDPYIELYTKEGMKFLALKLTADANVNDIEPFKVTLPGTSPGIPLRLTTLAAEPEMGVKAWVFAGERYTPANAAELEIDEKALRWKNGWAGDNNYLALVARAVDEVNGMGWVVDMAGNPSDLRSFAENSPVNGPDQQAAQEALLEMMGDSKYMTRLYTRLAPEEMTYDPVFRRDPEGADVSRFRTMPYVEELCGDQVDPIEPPPCAFAACGSLGICREVEDPTTQQDTIACGCAPGATARTTFEPNGSTVTVSCQDQRLSFINPGDALRPGGGRLPDPCVGFDCGDHGRCISMNLTPTCQCEQGYVARGFLDSDGNRAATCVAPTKAIPEIFYELRPEDRPANLPAGRDVDIPPRQTSMNNAEVMDMLAAAEAGEDIAMPKSKGCAAGAPGGTDGDHSATWLALLALGGVAVLRRQQKRA